MGDRSQSSAAMMVLCSRCGDAVAAERCPTCGAPDPRAADPEAATALDEGLLDQVGVALAAQSALAARTATERFETASRLYEEAVVLRSRLRRQASLLRTYVAAREHRRTQAAEALEQVESALGSAAQPGLEVTGWSVTARLPRDRSCAAVARRVVDMYARERLGEQGAQDAMLIASELASNAFSHGDGAIVLTVRREQECVRIEVRDDGRPDGIRVVPEEEREAGGGRGLWVVEQLARRWGAVGASARVWAELALPDDAARRLASGLATARTDSERAAEPAASASGSAVGRARGRAAHALERAGLESARSARAKKRITRAEQEAENAADLSARAAYQREAKTHERAAQLHDAATEAQARAAELSEGHLAHLERMQREENESPPPSDRREP